MKPTFEKADPTLHCAFLPTMAETYELDADDFFVTAYPRTKQPVGDDGIIKIDGKIAVLHFNKWLLEDATLIWDPKKYYEYRPEIICHDRDKVPEKMAYPIDPLMKDKDINGATLIYPNATSNGWLFAHATKADHIDRMFIASTAMSSLFDRVMEDKLQQTLASIINNPQTNQQRGVYLKWADMLDFKKDCTSYCVRFEKLLYLGQHKQQKGLNLRDMLLLCVKHVKGEWQKVDQKFDGVSGDVNGIIAHLETDHDWETRWEQEARHKAEAAARETSDTSAD